MKSKLTLGLLIALCATLTLSAQTIEITPSYGYQFGTKLNYGRNYIKMDDSGQFGITVGVETMPNLMAEVSYVNQSTELRIRDVQISPSEDRLSDLNVDWFQIGVLRYFDTGKTQPFLGTSLGITVFSPKNENRDIVNRSLDNSTEFSFTVKGGANFWITDAVGINIQGNLMFPVSWGGVYVGGGPGGVGGGVSVSSTTVIGGFSGGLVFRLN